MSTLRFLVVLAALGLVLQVCDLTARLEAAEARLTQLRALEEHLNGF